MKFHALLTLATILTGALCAQALTATSLLPAGVNSPSVRMGNIQGINERYVENGTLMKLGDYRSVVFDAPTLAKFNSDAKKLITALNRFGSQGLGDQFNLGVLKVDTAPVVKYYAPVYARGVTNHWTVGFGVPVVNYTNQISLSNQFSNIEAYRRQFSGLDPELDAALNTDLGTATNQALADKGYKTLTNRDETFVGDIQLVSMYRLFEDEQQALVYQAQLGLPTGPKYNPDDLAALNVFGRTTVNNTLVYSRKLGKGFSAIPYVSYLLNIQDDVMIRVPTSESDTLPEASAKENLKRQIGNMATLGGSLVYDFSDSWSLGAGYEISQKEKDSYRGSKGSRYDLLSEKTALSAQRAKMEITYSSVKSYFKKAALIPTILAFEISDVVAGVNVERQLVQELNLMLFF
jgi:hypothetical protein